MIEHITLIFIMAFTAQGAYVCLQDEMILGWVGRALSSLPLWLHKPTHTCPVCMVSIWGVPAIFYASHFSGYVIDPWMLPVYLLSAAGINWALA